MHQKMARWTCRQWSQAAAITISTGFGLILLLAGPAQAAPSDTKDVASREAQQIKRITAAIDGHIRPRLSTLVTSAETLANDTSLFCKRGRDKDRAQLRRSFASTVSAWAAVSHLRFGPIAANARSQRISFWPDPRSIVWRQLKTVQGRQDAALLIPGVLREQSVAIQGLSALDMLLDKKIEVGAAASSLENYRCQLAVAIANNVMAITKAIKTDWGAEKEWRAAWLVQNPNGDETKYSAAMTDLVKSVLIGFQIIREQQVLVLQNLVAGKGKAARLPYFRSGLATQYLRASVEGTCELLNVLDLGVFTPTDKPWIKTWLPDACRILKQRAASIDIPTSKDGFPGGLKPFDLRQLRFYTNSLRQIIGRQIAPGAGLTIGFNELDGD